MKIMEVIGAGDSTAYVYTFKYVADVSDPNDEPVASLEDGPIDVQTNGLTLPKVAEKHCKGNDVAYTYNKDLGLAASFKVSQREHTPHVDVDVCIASMTELSDQQVNHLEQTLSSELGEYVTDAVNDHFEREHEQSHPYSSRGLSKSDFN